MSAVGPAIFAVIRALCDARRRKGVSQADLALRLRVTRQAIAAWECGVNVPSVENLFRWAAALEVRIGVLPPDQPVAGEGAAGEARAA